MHSSILPGANASPAVLALLERAEEELAPVFRQIEATELANQRRVLAAFQKESIAQRHFAPTTGYGYDDTGRDALGRVFALSFGAESALVRPQIVNGTHALYIALSGLLRPGDTLLSITGKPYDTLEQAIGTVAADTPQSIGSLREFGIQYREVALGENGTVDLEAVRRILIEDPSVRIVYAQRSRGYAWREALHCAQMEQLFSAVRETRKDVIIVVDNCYGEFTEQIEPCAAGADIVAGSLIKNPGGGLALTGGYIAGKEAYVESIAHRLTVPGMGREVGSYAGSYQPFYQGLFLSPHVVAQSLKSAALFARSFELAGMQTMPASAASRADIIQAVRFSSREALISFVQSIQKAAPVDSFAIPEPWDMPGYTSQVIMAAGTFVQGASIELSADAPIREPYTAYLQGALSYAHGKIACMMAMQALLNSKEIQL